MPAYGSAAGIRYTANPPEQAGKNMGLSTACSNKPLILLRLLMGYNCNHNQK